MMASKWVVGVLAGVLAVSGYAWAEEAASEAGETKVEVKEEKKAKPEKQKEAKPPKAPAFFPFKELTSLTDEQKEQIATVHKKYLDEHKKLEEAEKAELKALLTPEQVAEMEKLEEAKAAEKKAKEAEKRQAKKKEATEEGKVEVKKEEGEMGQ
jgi:hypothetical protein